LAKKRDVKARDDVINLAQVSFQVAQVAHGAQVS
jgi:hypothetical protein